MVGVSIGTILGADVIGLDSGFDDILGVGKNPGYDPAQAASCKDPGSVGFVAPGIKFQKIKI